VRGQEQGLLVGEQRVDVGLRDAGPARDGRRRGAMEAVLGELGDGGVDDLSAAIGGDGQL
jgi:hypothetical protein